MSSRPESSGPRRRTTRPGVRVAERFARLAITVGGVGTIAAVTLILVFLVWVVAPLFLGARVSDPIRSPAAAVSGRPLHVAVDEHQVLCWVLSDDGVVCVQRLDTGELIERRELLTSEDSSAAPRLTAASFAVQGDEVALGFSDGTLRTGRIGFTTTFLDENADLELARELATSSLARRGSSLVQRTSDGQLRSKSLSIALSAPIETGTHAAILRVDRSESGTSQHLCALDASGKLFIEEVTRRENMLTGEVVLDSTRADIPFELPSDQHAPDHLLISGGGETLYLAWRDGHLLRFDTRNPEHAVLAEDIDLVEGDGELTSFEFLIGKTTLISGDSKGRVRAWFGIKPRGAGTHDGVNLVRAHDLSANGAPITAIACSARSRVIAVQGADASLRLYHVTSRKLLGEMRVENQAGDDGVAIPLIAPKEDGLFAWSPAHVQGWSLDLGHPEASLAALFRPVWYEGSAQPEHVWQATTGDDVEPKLGLVPLVFGTLKATLYSMLIAVPLALFAAIFTSEFLSPRLRAPLKSMTEMMASMPSVVLGFLAAILIAPFVQKIVPAVLTGFFTVPFALILGAHVWQILPQRWTLRAGGTPRFFTMALSIPIGVFAAWRLGPSVEKRLFAGDIMLWLDRQVGNSIGGWVLLLLPLSAVVVWIAVASALNPWLRHISTDWSRARSARIDFAKLIAGAAVTIALAFAAAWMLDGLWLDPRGSVLDRYDQRNALVVGFVMGFAVIPIIYTLAEDALSSVPQHLRLASLGAGATPWQTARRVVIPTAMSGLFSAVMIGLGRAVGETMIVFMATGNTPVMSWNVFNGFRTLSANISGELPEAVRNSTHYRTLFLAALCLFAMTFVFNTLAELVRQRFRRRAYQL